MSFFQDILRMFLTPLELCVILTKEAFMLDLTMLLPELFQASQQIHDDLVRQQTWDQVYLFCKLGLVAFCGWLIYKTITTLAGKYV